MNQNQWLSFSTLANKFVLFRPAALRKVWLLDDACDEPPGDWELDLPYEGLPLEMYRAFATIYDAAVPTELWVSAAELVRAADAAGRGFKDVEKTPEWKRLKRGLKAGFGRTASARFLSAVAEQFAKDRLYDDDVYFKYMHYTDLHLTNGGRESFWVEPAELRRLVFDAEVESVPTMIRLEHFGAAAEAYYPSRRVKAVVMPLIDLLDAIKEDQEALEREDEATRA